MGLRDDNGEPTSDLSFHGRNPRAGCSRILYITYGWSFKRHNNSESVGGRALFAGVLNLRSHGDLGDQ